MLDLLVPPSCAACGAPPPRRGVALCARCRASLPWLHGELCGRCGLPRPCGRVTGGCPAARAAFSASWAPLAHAGPARRLVLALKERGAVRVADLLAAQVAASVPEPLTRGATVVPVPADPLRRRLRGVDHTALLAGLVAARTALPAAAVLRRRGHAAAHAGAGRRSRLAGAGVARVEVVDAAPAVVLLVDDVHTTGATLDAAARALLLAGAQDVRAVTVTRTLHARG
ncbi:ComF family protein [Conexibacter sp. SYSU D00693]|uniref:ComF family protein n=1 Tax=Conexibacter sp. SYSU D00693 TaxID=2812560 RepID=UPI00196A359F|nr:double zinc ribbon domain-containing protein [Conexibacter sp. SYSU D00693]